MNMTITMSVGFLSDKLQRRKPIPMVAAFLCVLGIGLYMQADGFAFALLGMALATAPSGMIMGQMFAMARNHFTRMAPNIVEMSQLWLRATFSVGFFAGLLLGANIYLVASFEGVLWGNLLGYAGLLAILFFTARCLPNRAADRLKGRTVLSRYAVRAIIAVVRGRDQRLVFAASREREVRRS